MPQELQTKPGRRNHAGRRCPESRRDTDDEREAEATGFRKRPQDSGSALVGTLGLHAESTPRQEEKGQYARGVREIRGPDFENGGSECEDGQGCQRDDCSADTPDEQGPCW